MHIVSPDTVGANKAAIGFASTLSASGFEKISHELYSIFTLTLSPSKKDPV